MRTKWLKILAAVAAMVLGAARAGATDEGEPAARLQKGFVWSPTSKSGQQAYVAFRRGFVLKEAPGTATLRIFADSRYILWINGKQVSRGPCRFDPRWPEYDQIDVAKHLKSGKNAIAVLVHHYAGGRNSKIISHAPGLTLLLQTPTEAIATDSTWRCSAKTNHRPSPSAWGSIPDVIDGRIERGDWTSPDFDDSTWEPAAGIDGAQWGALRERQIPAPRETEITGLKLLPSGKDLSAALPVELSAGQEIIVNTGRMVMAHSAVELDAEAGSVLHMQFALRYLNGKCKESYGVGATYTARAGRQNFITGDEWGCHYITLRCVSGRIRLLGLRMTDRLYPFERVGRFSCNDEFLNRLWEMAVHTIEVTTDDGYGSDARERNEWLQDPAEPNFITTRVALAGPGKDGRKVYSDPRLLKNLMHHIAMSQTPDGRLKAHSLSDRWDCHGYIEDYACQWVESLRLYYEATGDKAFVREMWPALTKQMRWFLDQRKANGLVLARQYTSFDDPLAYVTCQGTALNAFIYQAMVDSAWLGRVIDETTAANDYDSAARSLKESINANLWNVAEGTYNSGFVKGKLLGPTAHAALLALDRGATPEERKPIVRKWLLANMNRPAGWHCGRNRDYEKMVADRAGIGMTVTHYWLFQEMYRMNSAGMDQLALRQMRERWTPMVTTSTDCGTLWETFTGHESCHNYGSVPAYFLSSYVLGVRLDGGVWQKQLRIEPRLGDLTMAQGVVSTELGPVAVSWTRDGDSLTFKIETPQGASAKLYLPEGNPATLVLDGKPTKAELSGRFAAVKLAAGAHEGRITLNSVPVELDANVAK